MQDLNVTLLQTHLHWESKQANLEMFDEKIRSINQPTDVIVLPEMFNTGFSMNSTVLAEKMDGKTIEQMGSWATNTDAVITGSLIIEENNNYYNRMVWMQPNGNYQTYDKRHLFRMMDEHDHFSPGTKKIIVEWKGWRICPLVCYDLRFPVWSRNTGENKKPLYDCLLYVANWPAARVGAWNTLLKARAIENHCYVAGVNRIGEDGNGVSFSGGTAAIDPKGETIWSAIDNEEAINTISFSGKDLLAYREKFPVWMDADEVI